MNVQKIIFFEQLNKILNAQISPLVKAGMGYEGEYSKSKVQDNNATNFVKNVIGDNDNSHQAERNNFATLQHQKNRCKETLLKKSKRQKE